MNRERNPNTDQITAGRINIPTDQTAAVERLINTHATRHHWPDHDRHTIHAILGITDHPTHQPANAS